MLRSNRLDLATSRSTWVRDWIN